MSTEEKIEKYVSGKMKGSQLAEMEQLIGSDKAIAGEVALQKAIVQAIQVERKMALKVQLSNIPAGTIVEFGQEVAKVAFLKSAAMIVGAIFTLGIGTLLYVNKNQEKSNNISKTFNKAVIKKQTKTQVAVNLTKTDLILDEKIDEIKTVENTKIESKTFNVQKKAIAKSKLNQDENSRSFLDNKFENESETFVKSDVKENKDLIAAEPTSKAAEVDIKSIKDGKHRFHYSRKENLLCLYGSFDDSPYEILELNDTNGQEIYLFYKNAYYTLKNTSNGVERLRKITDEKLLEALAKVRKH